MPIEIYGMLESPPSRIAMLTCEALGLEYKMTLCDLEKGDNKKEEYLKLNPQHTIPTMVDEDGFVLNESRVIGTYLAAKHENEKLYPKDLKIRARIDSALDFDMGTFYKAFGDVVVSIKIRTKCSQNSIDRKLERFEDTLGIQSECI